jgi:hypothetical protein
MVSCPLLCSDNPADAQAAAAAAVAAGFLPPSALPPGYKCAHEPELPYQPPAVTCLHACRQFLRSNHASAHDMLQRRQRAAVPIGPPDDELRAAAQHGGAHGGDRRQRVRGQRRRRSAGAARSAGGAVAAVPAYNWSNSCCSITHLLAACLSWQFKLQWGGCGPVL